MAFGAVGAASIYKFVQAASDAAETQSKFNIAFSESKDEANAWAMTMSSSLGRSQTDLKNYSSTMKTMLDSAGFTDQMASAMAKSFTVLAVDMASFNNMAEDDVFYRLMSGINGSTEALERFGINLKASAMDEKLLQLGLSQTNKDLTENQKKMLRTIILFESQADTVGDAVRTYDQFANQLRSLKAVFTDFAATVGNYMINMLLPTMRQLNDMLVSMSAIAEKSGKQMVEAFVTAAGVASAAGCRFCRCRNFTHCYCRNRDHIIDGNLWIGRCDFIGNHNRTLGFVSCCSSSGNRSSHGIRCRDIWTAKD